jgi:hypothetical protein
MAIFVVSALPRTTPRAHGNVWGDGRDVIVPPSWQARHWLVPGRLSMTKLRSRMKFAAEV